MDGKKIVAVDIQQGTERLYYIAKRGLRPEVVYVRQEYSFLSATNTAIRHMIKETDGDHFEEMRSLEQNLTFEKARIEFADRNIKFGQAQMKTLGIMTQDGVYTNLGLLLSDQCVHTIKSAVFEGTNQNQFKDRIEFTSIGGLVSGVTLKDVMMGISVCRNAKLANVFYRLELIEAYGTGILKIMDAYEGTGKCWFRK